MIFNWDEPTISTLTIYTDWDTAYFLYVPPTVDDPVVVDRPTTSFLAVIDGEYGQVVGMPRVVYGTNAMTGDRSNLALPTFYNILFHDGGNMAFHDGSDMAFHAYVFPDIIKTFNMPRTVYSGSAE